MFNKSKSDEALQAKAQAKLDVAERKNERAAELDRVDGDAPQPTSEANGDLSGTDAAMQQKAAHAQDEANRAANAGDQPEGNGGEPVKAADYGGVPTDELGNPLRNAAEVEQAQARGTFPADGESVGGVGADAHWTKRIDELETENKALKNEVSKLQDEVVSVGKAHSELVTSNGKLQQRYDELKAREDARDTMHGSVGSLKAPY